MTNSAKEPPEKEHLPEATPLTLVRLLLYLLISCLFFSVIHVLHFRVFQPKIIFYAGILDCLITFAVTFVGIHMIQRNSAISLACALIVFFAGLCYVALVPTMIDRSWSVYILLAGRDAGPNGVPVQHFNDAFVNSYHVEKRCYEQVYSGTGVLRDDRLFQTRKGRLVANLFYFDALLLGLPDPVKTIEKTIEKDKQFSEDH